MTYDPVDTNDDGVVDADVNNQSVSTDNQTITESFAGESLTVSTDPANPTQWLNHVDGSRNVSDERAVSTVSADNSATTILDSSEESGFFIVSAHNVNSGQNRFVDVIAVAAASISVIQTTGQNSAPTRSYSGRLDIAIDDAGETYDVVVSSIGITA